MICVMVTNKSTSKFSEVDLVGYQVVANCLSALQEIWSSEATNSEEASRDRETLLRKPVVYYLLNRYVHISYYEIKFSLRLTRLPLCLYVVANIVVYCGQNDFYIYILVFLRVIWRSCSVLIRLLQ